MIELSSVTMQEQGRIEPILSMAPEEAKSQPLVMVNVYTRGVLSGISLQPRKRELVCQKDLCLKVDFVEVRRCWLCCSIDWCFDFAWNSWSSSTLPFFRASSGRSRVGYQMRRGSKKLIARTDADICTPEYMAQSCGWMLWIVMGPRLSRE